VAATTKAVTVVAGIERYKMLRIRQQVLHCKKEAAKQLALLQEQREQEAAAVSTDHNDAAQEATP
jgi:hypothetical protein